MSIQERLIGVIHLAPLPGSPRFGGAFEATVANAASDAAVLREAGFDAAMVENYGDVPFHPDRVAPITIAAMTRCALAARAHLPIGINVLRNDAAAALAIAAVTDATMVRVNVHTGARLCDQGVVTGRAAETLRLRRDLGLATTVKLLCDVAVKHSSPLTSGEDLAGEVRDTVERGLADAVLVTGEATGASADARQLDLVGRSAGVPVFVASGVTPDNIPRQAHGVIVGSWLRADGKAGGPIDAARAREFAEAYRRVLPAASE